MKTQLSFAAKLRYRAVDLDRATNRGGHVGIVPDHEARIAAPGRRRRIDGKHLECQLKPLDPVDYAPVTLTAAQLARLRVVFADGVCDWSKPGVGQQEAISPLTFTAGPGGQPLSQAPESHGR